jgi:mannose-6-phosphate isomerase-like protein (cupin superfamily)
MNTNDDWTEQRPWGSFTVLDRSDRVWVKRIEVDPLKRLSLQRHQQRKEIWLCVSGHGMAHVDGHNIQLIAGSTVMIERNQWHRLIAGEDGITIIELAHGIPDENDIERRQDDYGRH